MKHAFQHTRSKLALRTVLCAPLLTGLIACDSAYVTDYPAVLPQTDTSEDRIVDEDIESDFFGVRDRTIQADTVSAPATSDLRAKVKKKRENSRKGAVSGLFYWPLFAIHSAVLPDGKVMTYGATKNQSSDGLTYDVWNPLLEGLRRSHSTKGVQSGTNLFCSAQSLLPSGDLLITAGDRNLVGGPKNDGVRDANLFSPQSNAVIRTGSMAFDRWYPTNVPLANGEVLVHGGRIAKNDAGTSDDVVASTPEIYNPSTGSFRRLNGAARKDIYDADTRGWYYPRSWLTKTNDVFFFKPNSSGFYSLDTDGRGSIKTLGSSKHGEFRLYYPSVMFDDYKILTFRPNRVTTMLNLNRFQRGIVSEKKLASIPLDRIWSDATVLADGSVLVSGGSQKRQDLNSAVYDLHLYDPKANKWTTAARASAARLYHSTAVLLPSGAVLMAGGGPPGPIYQLNAELYYPPYLFNADGSWASRPSLNGLPASSKHGARLQIRSNASKLSKVSMVRLGSATHSNDMTQRYQTLSGWRYNNGQLTLTLPTSKQSLRPGTTCCFCSTSLASLV